MVYINSYKDNSGIKFLEQSDIEVDQIDIEWKQLITGNWSCIMNNSNYNSDYNRIVVSRNTLLIA